MISQRVRDRLSRTGASARMRYFVFFVIATITVGCDDSVAPQKQSHKSNSASRNKARNVETEEPVIERDDNGRIITYLAFEGPLVLSTLADEQLVSLEYRWALPPEDPWPGVTTRSLVPLDECAPDRVLVLDLGHTPLVGSTAEQLKRFERLEWLRLPKTTIDRDLQYVGMLKKLQWLGLAGTKVTGSEFEYLNGLGQLRVLNLRKSAIDDDGIRKLPIFPRLESLSLGYTNITDAGLRELSRLSRQSLKELSLEGTRISDRGIGELRVLSNLEILHLFGCRQCSDRSIETILELPNLRLISVGVTAISDKGIETLSKQRPNLEIDVAD